MLHAWRQRPRQPITVLSTVGQVSGGRQQPYSVWSFKDPVTAWPPLKESASSTCPNLGHHNVRVQGTRNRKRAWWGHTTILSNRSGSGSDPIDKNSVTWPCLTAREAGNGSLAMKHVPSYSSATMREHIKKEGPRLPFIFHWICV